MGGTNAPAVPSLVGTNQPRVISFSFPGVPAAPAPADQRLLSLVEGGAGARAAGVAGQPDRLHHEHHRWREGQISCTDRSRADRMNPAVSETPIMRLDDYVPVIGGREVDDLRALAGQLAGRT